MRHATTLITLAAVLAFGVACTSTDAGTDGTTVGVTLADDAVTLDPGSAPAGSITFATTNDGSATHEIEVFTADGVDPTTLPVSDGVASTEGMEMIDEIHDITPGSSADLTLDLEPGTYAVMCNLPDHYANGMVAVFEVT
jgi:uncharacterized cupredoxin-like copper-binding protein